MTHSIRETCFIKIYTILDVVQIKKKCNKYKDINSLT